jgi:hypothetical protein
VVVGAGGAPRGAPIPKDTHTAPAGPAPWLLYLTPDESGRAAIMVYKNQKVTTSRAVTETVEGKAVTKFVQEQTERLTATHVLLDSLKPNYITVGGTALTHDQAMKRAKDGVAVLVSADGKPVSKNWLRAIDPDTMIVSSEGLVSPMAPRATTAVPTLAPRLVLLGTGADGKVQVAYNPGAANHGVYSDHMGFARANRVVFINNGQAVMLGEDGGYFNPNATPAATVAPTKTLEDIQLDAYDLTGKRVAKVDALKQLKAGGLVLISGDTRAPDPAYLTMFRSDLLVLVSPELLNVPLGSKRSKPTADAKPAVAPAPAALPAAPAIRLVLPAVLQAAPLKVQPAQAAPPKVAEKK